MVLGSTLSHDVPERKTEYGEAGDEEPEEDDTMDATGVLLLPFGGVSGPFELTANGSKPSIGVKAEISPQTPAEI